MIGHLYIVNNEEEHGLNCFKVGFTSDLKRRLDDFNSATTTIGEYKLHRQAQTDISFSIKIKIKNFQRVE